MKNRALGITANRRLHEGVVVSISFYDVETWNTRETDRRRLDVFLNEISAGHARGVKNGQSEEWGYEMKNRSGKGGSELGMGTW